MSPSQLQADVHVPQVNATRIMQRLEHLVTLTDPDIPYTRRAFSDLHMQARQWLEQQYIEAGLTPRYDAASNLIGRREGSQTARTLALGSHIDTVTGGGRFDGILGVLVGLELAQTLDEANITLQHALEIIDFTSEEVSDYQAASCIGSRAFGGTLDDEMLARKNPAGEVLTDAINRTGGNADKIQQTVTQDYAGYLELHIEQGRVLEAEHLSLGIVTGIVTIRRYELTVTGQPDHAGTTPMHLRHDALVGAAWIIQHVQKLARQQEGLVATIGRIHNHPNGPNVVPGQVKMVLELRSLDGNQIEHTYKHIIDDAKPILDEDGLSLQTRPLSDAPGVYCDEAFQNALQEAAVHYSTSHRTMPSGAGHDAMQVANVCPVGMLFIPSLGGRSHTPDEQSRPEDIAQAAQVMLRALVSLDKQLG
ncbi:MAG: Zn-dependent hydrolase [Deinococcota bacterium]